jgi:N-acetylglucosaminyldiphosphoundecaprenol N-acetyl-beta-D-mannosaminyltransferase
LNEFSKVRLLGVSIHTLHFNQLLQIIERTIQCQDKATIAYVNVYAINIAQNNALFQDFLNHANVAFCDGYGIKWGSRLLGSRIPHRYTLVDWLPSLSELCCRQDFTLFFLGARPGVAEAAAERLQERFTGLQIVGTYHGYFDKTPGSSENDYVIQMINAARPDILVVGFGMPLQEQWLAENWSRVDANVAILGGAIFDYLSGSLPRGPRWMTNNGLEWLARLVVEPGRLWRRYLIGNPLFVWRILKQRLSLVKSSGNDVN